MDNHQVGHKKHTTWTGDVHKTLYYYITKREIPTFRSKKRFIVYLSAVVFKNIIQIWVLMDNML